MRLPLVALIAALMLAAVPARADLVRCKTSIRGEARHFLYDPDNKALRESRSMREWLFGSRGEITCPGLVTLRVLTPELVDAERDPFCLQWSARKKTYTGFAQGPRDAWMVCRKPSKSFCQRVNASTSAAGKIIADTRAFGHRVGGSVLASPLGVLVVQAHAAELNTALSQLGVAAAANPGTLSALAVSTVVVQGAIYVCSDEGAGAVAAQAAPDTTLKDGARARAEADVALLGAELPVTAPGDEAPVSLEPEGPPAADAATSPLSPATPSP